MDYVLQHAEVPKVSRRVNPRPRKYPFHDMQPGMMFFTPGAKPSTMMSLASATGKRLGWTFQTRQLHMRLVKGRWLPCPPDTEGATFGVAVYRTN
jgi:hypothetical protein